MGGDRRFPLAAARIMAEAIVHYLEPVCDRIAIAGSIRREKEDVGDIEIVAQPTLHRELDMFEEEYGPKLDRIHEAVQAANEAEGPWLEYKHDPETGEIQANGNRYKKLFCIKTEMPVDLFLIRPPAEWGPIFAIRTGPAKFSQKLVKGLHRREWKSEGGRVVNVLGRLVSCPEEKDFFKACGIRYRDPPLRR